MASALVADQLVSRSETARFDQPDLEIGGVTLGTNYELYCYSATDINS